MCGWLLWCTYVMPCCLIFLVIRRPLLMHRRDSFDTLMNLWRLFWYFPFELFLDLLSAISLWFITATHHRQATLKTLQDSRITTGRFLAVVHTRISIFFFNVKESSFGICIFTFDWLIWFTCDSRSFKTNFFTYLVIIVYLFDFHIDINFECRVIFHWNTEHVSGIATTFRIKMYGTSFKWEFIPLIVNAKELTTRVRSLASGQI